MSPAEHKSPRASEAVLGAWRVALLYAGISALWILLSDRAVAILIPDPAAMTKASIVKGWAFVAVTAMMLFVMVKRLVLGVATREAKLQALIHTIPDLVWLKDPQGIYLGCNRAFERLYGASEAAIVGRTDFDFVAAEQAQFFQEKDREAITAGTTRENEEWVTLAETGQEVLLQTLKTPLHDASGELIGVLGIGRDITERRRMEARLSQAEKMELVGQFAGGVAHDYNNMLSVILANAELVLFKESSEWPLRRQVEEIVRAARHSADRTAQLLAFARQQPSHPRPVSLPATLEDVREVLERLVGPGIEMAWQWPGDLWRVRADPTQLCQVVTNLVTNARDALAGEGRITVSASNICVGGGPEPAPQDPPPGDYVGVSVTDEGCGMPPEVALRIFEPFFTTKAEGRGTGLGLAMVHGIVQQHGGAVRVDSEPDRGTRIEVLFPRA